MNADIHGLTGAYALGALDDVERARFEKHLAGCADCRAEVESFDLTVEHLAEVSAIEPPARLEQAILSALDQVRPLPPVTPAQKTRPRRLLRAPFLLAAAVVVLVIGAVAAIVLQPWAEQEAPDRMTVSEQVVQAPDAERIEVPMPGEASATLVMSKSMDRAVIVTEAMPDAPSGHTYEVWLQQEEGMVAAGPMTGGSGTVLLRGSPSTASGMGISVERAGAEPSSPSDTMVAHVEM